MPEAEAWRLSELRGDNGELRGLVRKRAPLPSDGRTWRAWFTLEFTAGRNHLPSSDDMKRMASFEDRLVEQIEEPGLAVLVAVVIVDGRRDHLFYLSDRDAFFQKLAPLAKEVSQFRPHLDLAPDPDWNEFNEMIG
jgi:hypothetical protein